MLWYFFSSFMHTMDLVTKLLKITGIELNFSIFKCNSIMWLSGCYFIFLKLISRACNVQFGCSWYQIKGIEMSNKYINSER